MTKSTMCQCEHCHRVYIIDSEQDLMICPTCRARSEQAFIIRLPAGVA